MAKINIPNPNKIFPNKYKTSCYIKNVIKAPNIIVGDYTYYDDDSHPEKFEENNVLFNYPEFGDKLIIGKFCCIASKAKFVMGPANHRLDSISVYPFNVFGGAWKKITKDHISELPHKGDTIIGNDVWIGRESTILPGVHIGDGAIIGANSVVAKSIPPYCVAVGNPARVVKKRFSDQMIKLLLELKWWDLNDDELLKIMPLLCDNDIAKVEKQLTDYIKKKGK